jgi:hypothetical protein
MFFSVHLCASVSLWFILKPWPLAIHSDRSGRPSMP